MKPVNQTKFGDGGNCQQAVLASLLKCDLDDVPDFANQYKTGETMFYEMNRWLIERIGYYFLPFTVERWWIREHLHGIWIAGVKNIKTQIKHVVIMEHVEMIHDPAGRTFEEYQLEEVWILTPMKLELDNE